MPAKACSRCGATKPASDFNINKTTSSGLTSHCKVLLGLLQPPIYEQFRHQQIRI